MTKISRYIFIVFAFLIFKPHLSFSQSQCNTTTPKYYIDLSAKSDTSWTINSIGRAGTCCTSQNNCVEFIVTLNANAEAISLEVTDGSGALSYSVNCSAPISSGQKYCVTGVGPHSIVFCKSGANLNSFRIKSIPRPMVSANMVTRSGCAAAIVAVGFQESTIQWKSIPNNATYNALLSCQSACDSVLVNTPSNPPAFIDYEVSGTPIGACSGIFSRDTVRVSFVNPLQVSVTPSSVYYCTGSNTATLNATVSGGNAPYTYLWSNGSTNSSINATAGNYTVVVRDATNCSSIQASGTIIQDQVISINAGSNTSYCSNSFPIQLAGACNFGGVWEGGNGTFVPNRNSLTATYLPTAAELLSGSVNLILKSSNTANCPALIDTVTFQLKASPNNTFSGQNIFCGALNQTATYTVNATVGMIYNWSSTGTILSGAGTNSIVIRWPIYENGNVQLQQTATNGCSTNQSLNVIISAKPITGTINH